MSDYHVDQTYWREQVVIEELNAIKAQLKAYQDYISSPVMRSFHITETVREEFEHRLGKYVKNMS